MENVLTIFLYLNNEKVLMITYYIMDKTESYNYRKRFLKQLVEYYTINQFK